MHAQIVASIKSSSGDPVEGTCEWIEQCSPYCDWRDNGIGSLWIQGGVRVCWQCASLNGSKSFGVIRMLRTHTSSATTWILAILYGELMATSCTIINETELEFDMKNKWVYRKVN